MLKGVEYLAVVTAVLFAVCLIALMFFYGSPSSSSQSPQQQHSEENKAEKKQSEAEKPFWEKATTDPVAAFTLFLVVFTAILSAVGVIQLKMLVRAETVSEKTAQAAKDSADVAKVTLIASQRAWIRLDEIGLGGGGLAFDQNGASVAISFKITNVGNSPATNITAHAWLIALKNGGPFALQEQERLCRDIRNQPFGMGFTLFPNETFPSNIGLGSWSLGTNISNDEVAKGLEVSSDRKHVVLQVFGCVDYTFPTDPTVHHQTGFIRDLRMKGPIQISPSDGIIPIDRLMLTDTGIGLGQYAD